MEPAGVVELQKLAERIIEISVGLSFVALLIVLVVGAIKFLISGGEPKQIQGASQTVTWAILGIIFLALIWLILKLIQAFTGVPVTDFCIGFPPYCIFKN